MFVAFSIWNLCVCVSLLKHWPHRQAKMPVINSYHGISQSSRFRFIYYRQWSLSHTLSPATSLSINFMFPVSLASFWFLFSVSTNCACAKFTEERSPLRCSTTKPQYERCFGSNDITWNMTEQRIITETSIEYSPQK